MPTSIEWVRNPDGTKGETWNPISGCSKISAGCLKCYAERMSKRLAGRFGYPAAPHNFDVTLHSDKLTRPMHWKKPRRVFVASMGDLFHRGVYQGWIDSVFHVMHKTPRHTYMILTKRPDRMSEWVDLSVEDDGTVEIDVGIGYSRFRWPLPNVYFGVTVENADQLWRIDHLLATPAAMRFVSVEPMLSEIDIHGPLWGHPRQVCERTYVTHDQAMDAQDMSLEGTLWTDDEWEQTMPALDLVICGAETGPGARPMDLDWARDLRDQCQAANVSFFFARDSDGNRELDGRLWEQWPDEEE